MSERSQIALFRLSYFGQPEPEPPPELRVEVRGPRGSLSVSLRGTGEPRYDQLYANAFSSLDQQIQSTFVNLGRFDVIGYEQRLTSASVNEFIRTLQDYQSTQTEVPEAVLLGRQTFTEADFRELAGGFVVVVPSVTFYSLRQDEDGNFASEMQTSFTFVDVEDMQVFDQFFVETSGFADNAASAVRAAVDSVPSELTFRIREMDAFRIRTGVIEVSGREVIVEFGQNMGLRRGDEYAIVGERVMSNGFIESTETGLLVIREVQQQFSYGYLLYANPAVQPGDQLREVPRRGVEGGFYFDILTSGLEITPVFGIRGVGSRGFYDWRPRASLEIPFRGIIDNTLLPINLLLGGEFNVYLGRIKLTPAASFGLGGAVPLSDDPSYEPFYLSHLGGQARVAGNLLVSRDIYVHVDLGFGYWFSLYSGSEFAGPLSSYGGLIIGGGVTIK